MVWVLKVFGLIAFQPVILLVEVVNKNKKKMMFPGICMVYISNMKSIHQQHIIHADEKM